MEYEYCCLCGELTGRTGEGNDSLYLIDGSGPYCQDCYDMLLDEEMMEY